MPEDFDQHLLCLFRITSPNNYILAGPQADMATFAALGGRLGPGDIGHFDGVLLTELAQQRGPTWAEELFLAINPASPSPVLIQDAVIAVIHTSTAISPIPGSHNARFLTFQAENVGAVTTFVKPGAQEVVAALRRRNLQVTSGHV